MKNLFNVLSVNILGKNILSWIEIVIVFLFVIWICKLMFDANRICKVARKKLLAERDTLEEIQTNPQVLNASWGVSNGIPIPASSSVYMVLSSSQKSGDFDSSLLGYSDWIQRSRYLAGIFVFIGLLGTVLGVGIAMVNLSGIFNGDGADKEKMNAIGFVITGLGYAAGCTLFGIAATLFVSNNNASYLQLAHVLEEDAERFFLLQIRPAFIREERLWMSNSLQNAVQEAHKIGNELLSNTLVSFKEEMKESLRINNKQLTNSLATIETEFMTGMQSMTSTIASIKDTISSVNDALAPTAKILNQASDTAKSVTETLEIVRERFDQSAQSLTVALTTGHTQLEIIERLVRDGAITLESGYGALSKIATQLESTVNGISHERSELLAAVKEDRTQTLSAMNDDRSKMIEGFSLGLNSYMEILGNERESMFKIVQTEARLAQTAAREALNSYNRLYNFHAENEQKQQAGISEFIATMQHAKNELSEILARFEETLVEVSVLSEQSSLPKTILDLRNTFDVGLNNVVKQQSETASLLRKQHIDLKDFQTGLLTEWKTMSKSTPVSEQETMLDDAGKVTDEKESLPISAPKRTAFRRKIQQDKLIDPEKPTDADVPVSEDINS